jgi:hypothetical protein
VRKAASALQHCIGSLEQSPIRQMTKGESSLTIQIRPKDWIARFPDALRGTKSLIRVRV